MERNGRADFVENINPNAILSPTTAEDIEVPDSPEAAAAQMVENTTTDPEIPDDQIRPPMQPTMDITYGSPFGTPISHHSELHSLAAQAAPQDNSEDLRSQLVGILQELQNQANFLQVVAQENPSLYQSINGLVQMVIQMARNNGLSKSEQRKSPVQAMTDSLRMMHPQHNCKNGDCYHASEALYHLLGGSNAGYTPFSDQGHWYLKSSTGKTVDPTSSDPRNGQPKKFVSDQPSQKAVSLINSVIRQGPLKKADLPAFKPPGQTSRKVARTYLQLPVGTQKGVKIKVLHRNGSTGWRQVQAGMVQGLEPDVPLVSANSHPISVKRPFDE